MLLVSSNEEGVPRPPAGSGKTAMYRSSPADTLSCRVLAPVVMIIAGALLACTGVSAYTPDTEQPDQQWQTERESDRAESKVLCCDGALAESCPCSQTSKGCCTNHDGVCGCQRGDS